MKIKDIALSAAYVGQRVVKAICVGAQEIWSAVKYIVFADPVVAQICATNWGDGTGLTEEDAAKVTSIGTIFQGNKEITSFDELSQFSRVKSLDQLYAFADCTNLRSVDLSNITSMRSRAFSNCTSLSDIGDTSKVTSVETSTFYNCTSLTGDVNFPSMTGAIGWGQFSYTGVQRVISLGASTEIGMGAGTESQGAFSNCRNLTSVVLPNNVEKIGPFCFMRDINLVALINFNGNENIKQVKTYAIAGCSSLTIDSLELPMLEEMGDNATGGNESDSQVNIREINNLGKITYLPKFGFGKFANVRVPSTVTSCANFCFSQCPNLTTLIIEAVTPFAITENFISHTPIAIGNGTIYVPDQSVTAYREASIWSSYADRIMPLSTYVEQ